MPVVVVGAGPGMGRAIAAAVGREHGPVALIARRREPLQDIVDGLAGRGVTAAAFPADITDEQQLVAAIAAARTAHGPPSVVVFNASLFVPGPPTVVPLARFRAGLDTGITAALITLQATVEDLRAAAPDSCLLFTGGGLALNPWPPGIGLAIQKAGLRHLALATATELQPEGVHVGLVTIRGTIEAGGPFDPDRIAQVYSALADHRLSRPVEVTFTEAGPDWTPGS